MRTLAPALLALAVTAACVHVQRLASPRTAGSLCFVSTGVWPFGDSTDSSRIVSWMILDPRIKSHDDSSKSYYALVYDSLGNTQQGNWSGFGRDSLWVDVNDPFTAQTLRLQLRDSLLRGRAHGTTDQLVQVDSNTFAAGTYDWIVIGKQTPCPSVPSLPKPGGNAA